ncbi:hypothetical protein X801_04616 [Opisthorchis viverrini]|uniref:Uncharacterized protein n=1 Tax=Opisthorchis viverrini TaxID=6198 RepID=A0A1S8WYM6_OPIVI|nr:hypothetical protein X801_04616 [Opisthorchis viverrini]
MLPTPGCIPCPGYFILSHFSWKLLWMTFSQFTTRFEIEFLPVYNPNSEERMDPRLYANNVRSKMAEALNIPTCDLLYDDFCRFQIANECGLPDPEGMVYLHALLRTAFSSERFEDPRQCENASYRDWVHVRLEKLLSIARHKSYLSQLAFINAIFPNVQPNERETFLLNKAVQHYTTESSTGVDFRMFITRACLFLFASDLRTAIRYAVKAFPPKEPYFPNSPTEPLAVSSGSYDRIRTWAIRHSDAKQLILYVFNAQQQGTNIFELINLSVEYFDQDPMTSEINESAPVHPDRLYAALNAVPLPFPRSYLQFETLLSKTLGKRGRPLLHIDGTITSDLQASKCSFNTSELASYRRSTSAGTCNSDALSEPCVTNSSDKSRKSLPYAVFSSTPPLVDSNHNQTCAAAYRRTLPSSPFGNKLGNT